MFQKKKKKNPRFFNIINLQEFVKMEGGWGEWQSFKSYLAFKPVFVDNVIKDFWNRSYDISERNFDLVRKPNVKTAPRIIILQHSGSGSVTVSLQSSQELVRIE